MTNNSNTEPTSIISGEDEEQSLEEMIRALEQQAAEEIEAQRRKPINKPMVMKLLTGDELIVASLMVDRESHGIIVSNPYAVMRQLVNGVHHLYLAKWMTYAASPIFMISSSSVVTINVPNKEILEHYNTCLEEEYMDDIAEKATTSQISFARH